MRKGFAAVFIFGVILITIFFISSYFVLNKQDVKSPAPKVKQTPTSNSKTIIQNYQTTPPPKTTRPNNTYSWVYFHSELYGYSLRRPADFKKVLGNEDLFQATSKDYLEKDGVVTNGAIAQTITKSDESFEKAWGDIDSKLTNLDTKIVSKFNVLVGGQKAYKLKLENSDGTIEIRYLTYKTPYSYKTSILIGRDSTAEADRYEQILDDIISTFRF